MTAGGRKLRRALADIRAALAWDSTLPLCDLVRIANEDGVAVILHGDGRTGLILLPRRSQDTPVAGEDAAAAGAGGR